MKNRSDGLTAIVRILIISLFLMVLVVTGFSCQSQGSAPPTTSPPTEPTPGTKPMEVAIEGFAFKPAEINVPVGSTVTWSNKDSVTHTVTARDNVFDSSGLPRGATFSYTFEEKGTFGYYCAIHPYMEGKVVVE